MAVNRRGVAMMSSAHMVDDLYQGVLPAMLPFFVAERGYSYAAVAGLTLAASSNSAVSVFALGGNMGFALGSLVATPVLLWLGLRGTPLLLLPAAVMAFILIGRLDPVLAGTAENPRPATMPQGQDNRPAFLKLTSVLMVRFIVFF